MHAAPLVALVGNPNAGKSALFNALTGARQKIANYPGVTVERKAGRMLLASGEPVDTDYRIRVAATGDYRWMRARAQPRRDEQGNVIRWYGVVEDVHDRKLAEERLRASEDQFRVFAEAVPNHVWAGRPDGYLYWFNRQVYAYSGEAPGTLDGVTEWTRIIHPDG